MNHYRQIDFQGIYNFRDMGGYQTKSGRSLAWGLVFRSGDLKYATPEDIDRLKEVIKLTSVLDLRNEEELSRSEGKPFLGFGGHYFNVPLITGDPRDGVEKMPFNAFANLGEVYAFFIGRGSYGQRVVDALEIIADRRNHPLVFHCSAGKDRTGVLASILLCALGVSDQDIIQDYTMSGPFIKSHIARICKDPETERLILSMPLYMHESAADSMILFLELIRRDYGSIWDYLKLHGADIRLQVNLERALLI
jgi:protein-tyrosine phosphatase